MNAAESKVGFLGNRENILKCDKVGGVWFVFARTYSNVFALLFLNLLRAVCTIALNKKTRFLYLYELDGRVVSRDTSIS